jgi:uncharacterized repeat protein (TIGR02543 family)
MIVSYVTTSFVPVYVFAEDDQAAAETADVLMTEEAVPAEEPITEDTSASDEPSSVLTIHYQAAEGGSVTASEETITTADLVNGAVPSGAEAIAAEGYDFVNWTAGGAVVSESAYFVPSVTADMSGELVYTANFAAQQMTEETAARMVLAEYAASEGGSVSRTSETVDVNAASASFQGAEALTDEGYRFTGWKDADGTIVSTDPVFVPSVSADLADHIVYTAVFEKMTAMPAQDFEGTAGSVQVSVHADEGNFPEGTTMSLEVVPVSTILNNDSVQNAVGQDREVVDAAAVDITFKDSNGNKIEPVNAITVRMSTSSSVEGESHEVLHIDDSGNASSVTSASADSAEFEADAFSIYVITGIDTAEQKPAIATYIFHDADGNVITASTQKVKNGETVYVPDTPEKKGYKFLGWSYQKNTTSLQDGDPGDIAEFNAEVSKTGEVNLYPVFQQAYYVFFMDGKDGRVITTKEGISGDEITVSDVTIPLDSTHSVTGWYTDSALTEKAESVKLTDHNVTLYPKIEKGNYIYFNSGDNASYVEPAFFAAGANTSKPADPTRPGYTFKYWSAEENGSEYKFGSSITEDVTLYAVWEADDVSYTVIYWWENANDDSYSYHENSKKSGTSGSEINLSNLYKKYEGFTINTEKTAEANADARISGDGSTIVNVYYTRNTYSISFWEWKWQRYRYKWSEISNLQITAKYGANISDQWPTSISKIWGTTEGKNGQGAAPYQSGISTMPLYGDKFYYVGQSGKNTMNLNYYLEGLDGKYYLDHTDSFKSDNDGWSTTKEDHYDIEGFTYTGNVKDGTRFKQIEKNVYGVSFEYSRNSYSIKFVNGRDTTEKTVKYGADISNIDLSTAPARPEGVPSSYEFAGWYDNELRAGDPVKLSGTMPAHNITLYAKWTAPTYTATIHTNMKGTGDTLQLTVDYGSEVNENAMPSVVDADGKIIQEGTGNATVTVPENYSWIGWAVKNGDDFTVYNFNKQIYDDVTLYPYYINTQSFTVSYDIGKGSGTAPVDERKYAENSYADILSATGITPPEGKTFLYWKLDDDTRYYPGAKVKITDNLKLTAVYGDTAKKASIVYHSNYPAGSNLSEKTVNMDGLANNTAISLGNAGFAVPKGYYFAGWNTMASGNGTAYEAGTEVGIDNTSENHLYAVWAEKKEITLTANSLTVTYDGTEHTASGVETDTFNIDGVEYQVSGYQTENPAETDAGTYTNGIIGNFTVKQNNADVTEQFTVHTVDGSLTINKRTVNLSSGSASKQYDGTPLTNPSVTVSGDGFVDGEVSDLRATGSITDAGSVDNTIAYTRNSSFKEENYQITLNEGTLTITANTTAINVKAGSAEKTYDGKELAENSSTVTGLPEGFTAAVTVKGRQTDVGKAENKVTSVAILKDGKDVTAQFTGITTENGTLTVNKRTVNLSSESASKKYDGTALTRPDVTVGGDGFVEGEVSNLKAAGTITKVGSVKNTIAYTEGKNFKAGNYNINKTEGTLTVTKNDDRITVTAGSAEKTYDGTALENNEYSIDGLMAGFQAVVTVEGSRTDAGTAENNIASVVIWKGEEDVTDQFAGIATVSGTLTVTKRSVTLTSETASRAYDGTALTRPDVKVSGDGFVEGEVSDLKATGTITKVGSVKNTIEYTKEKKFKEDNYLITVDEGTLTVTENEDQIVVTANNAEKLYDGSPLTEAGATVTGLLEGYTAEVTTSGSITDAGSVDNTVESVVIKDAAGTDVTDHFKNIVTNSGTLTVKKRTVNLSSESASKEYDGTELTKPEVTVDGEGFVEGEVSDLRATGSITKAGSVDNPIAYTEGDNFKAGNYDINKTEGTLTVTKNDDRITVTAGSAEKTYDGEALEKNEYSIDGLPEGFTAEAAVKGSQTDAGTSANSIISVVITKDGEDVTDQFAGIVRSSGTLTVKKRTVNLSSESASKEYDGTELTKPEVTVGGEGFVEGEISDLNATGSITKTGNVKNTIAYTRNSSFNEKNYQITLNEGTLSITANTSAVSVRADSSTKTYDGTALEKNSSTVTGLPEGFMAEVKVEGSLIDAGTAENKVTSVVIKKGNEDVTNQFAHITADNGTLTVNKRIVNLSSESASKEYDGTALTRPDVKVDGDGFVYGEISDLKAAGSITKIGSVVNAIEYTGNSSFKEENYLITLNEGTLSITANTSAINIKADSDTKTYDGKALVKNTSIVTGLPEGFTAEVTVEGSQTDVGTAENNIASVVIWKGKEDVTNQFAGIAKESGTLTVTRRSVTLTSETASKAYDGTALTRPDVKVSGDGFVEGEVSDLKATGTITKVGSVKNTIEYTKEKKFKEDNYLITVDEGTLTVTENEDQIVVTANNAEKLYDGSPLTEAGATVTGLLEGYTAEVTTSGSITDAGSVDNTVESVVIKDAAGTDVTDHFKNIVTNSGTLTVKKRTVNLSSESASKEYDGTELTKPEVTVDGEGFVEGEVSDLRATGSITKAGSAVNTIAYTEGDNFKEENYTIEKEEGTLIVTVSNNEIIVTAGSAEKTYDGTVLVKNEYSIDGVPEGFTAEVAVKGSQIDAGTSANKVTSVVIKKDGEDVTDQFAGIVRSNGTLTVNKRTVNLSSESAEKEYDGTELTRPEVTVSGEGFVEGEVSDLKATGSITTAGSAVNTIAYKAGDNFKADNYDINKTEGTLIVTQSVVEIIITADDAEKMYDGTALVKDTYSIGGLPYGFTAEAAVTGMIIDAGSAANTVESVVIKDASGTDVTDQFKNITLKNGTLTVTKRSLIFTSASAEKEYDGKPLTAPEVTVSGDGFVDGEGAEFNVTGSQTEVGQSPNLFEYTLKGASINENTVMNRARMMNLFVLAADQEAEKVTKAENYSISLVYGTLTVTERKADPEPIVEDDEIKVNVQVVWDDNDNAEGRRPESVSVQLYQNGEALGEPVVLDAENGWTYTWSDLEADAVYEVVQTAAPEGYTSHREGDQNRGFIITNTLIPVNNDDDKKKPLPVTAGSDSTGGNNILKPLPKTSSNNPVVKTLPKTGAAVDTGVESNMKLWLESLILAIAAMIAAIIGKRKHEAE